MQDEDAAPIPPSPPSGFSLKGISAGVETVVGDHVAASSLPAPPSRHGFWVNLVLLVALAPLATFWFQQHLQPYFTQIVLIGGGLTLWAAIRLVWELVEKLTKLNPWDRSRSLLASPEVTRVLLVAWAALAVLWFSTASLYFEYEGALPGDTAYVVQVSRKPDLARFADNVSIDSPAKVVGGPHFWSRHSTPLECRIVQPARFEPFDCSLQAGASTRVKVPGSFKAKDLHLLRLVPAGMAYAELPLVADPPGTLHRLEMTVDGKTYLLADVRKQTVYVGGAGDDMSLALALEKPAEYEALLVRSLLAAQLDEASAKQAASVLASNPRPWDAIRVKPGQKLSLLMRWIKTDDGKQESGVVAGFPVEYTVTTERVQTIWLPAH